MLNQDKNYDLKDELDNQINKYSQICIFKFYDNTKLLKFIYYKKEKCVIYFNECAEMVYKGQFDIIRNQFEGYGTYYFSEDEKIYEGYFSKNKKNGLGTLTIKNKVKLHGKWKNDSLVEIIKEQYLKI